MIPANSPGVSWTAAAPAEAGFADIGGFDAAAETGLAFPVES
jgi:hypothetical protein